MTKTALICGVSGQDGAYLARHLLELGYTVWGTSRDAQMASFANLARLGIDDRVRTLSMAPTDFRSVLQAVDHVKPDEIYNLSGQSSVGLSFQQPMETLESITTGTLNLLEVIRFTRAPIRFYNAGSGECFGDTGDTPANEETPFRPRSPYAVAKAAAHWAVVNYREAYDLYACSGILFNHESPLRPARFVTRKVIQAACRIADGSNETVPLGDLDIERDWGWAPEYVEAIRGMLQQDHPRDLIIATGESRSLRQFVDHAFRAVGSDYRDHVVSDASLFRTTDIRHSRANTVTAEQCIGWTAQTTMEGVVERMIDAERSGSLDQTPRQSSVLG